MKPRTIEELAAALSLSEKALNDRRRMIRMANPKDVEEQLLAWLESAWEELRDVVKVPAKGSGYVEVVFGEGTPYHGAVLPGRTEDGYEPESVRDDVQTQFSVDARTRRAEMQERAKEQTKMQIRAVSEALRAKANRGEDLTADLARIARELRLEDAA